VKLPGGSSETFLAALCWRDAPKQGSIGATVATVPQFSIERPSGAKSKMASPSPAKNNPPHPNFAQKQTLSRLPRFVGPGGLEGQNVPEGVWSSTLFRPETGLPSHFDSQMPNTTSADLAHALYDVLAMAIS